MIDRLMPLVPELLSPTGKMVMIALDENDPQGSGIHACICCSFMVDFLIKLFFTINLMQN